MTNRVRHVIGCMTGTSLDGLDAALVRITGDGLAMRAEFVAMVSHPLGELADTLRSFANGNAHPPLDYLRAARKLGELHADACAELASQQAVDFVTAHGQTIWHAPRDRHGHSGGLSWQLFDPWPIVRQLRVPVCYDLRQADLIAGGEGAPITPIADPILYGKEKGDLAVVNLGGICNINFFFARVISLRGAHDQVEGLDVCPCNLLLDGLCQALTGRPYDEDGVLAESGRPRRELRETIGNAIRFAEGGAKSLGREQFGTALIGRILAHDTTAAPSDWLAAAVSWIAREILSTTESRLPGRAILAGGGVRNRALVRRLQRLTKEGTRVVTSDAIGIPSEAREAMAFAVLGALSRDGVPITLPQVTGSANPRRAGAWAYP